MTITEKQREQQAVLQKNLWRIANDLRGNMDASEFRNYILGLIFYRFLSEKTLIQTQKLLKEDNMSYEEAWEIEDYRIILEKELIARVGYVIEPQDLYGHLTEKIKNHTFEMENLHQAINKIESSTRGTNSEDDFEHLFDDMDLNSNRLGNTNAERTKLISKVMMNLVELPFTQEEMEIDMLGDAYEYLIGQFAATAGKKAGEFYTPQQVSKILAKIVTTGKKRLKSVYDPTCGSGSLLLRIGREVEVSHYYGQEYNNTTFNLARMNMLLHDINYQNFTIENGDTLEHPGALEEDRFEAVVANPPYSQSWSSDPSFLDDPRFSNYGRLAPKSRADFAFLQHMIYHLDDNGTMVIVLPHGVLFRAGAEEAIRTQLIEENYLDAVIGLPPNLFFGTGIPTCILVFKKWRAQDEKVLFIDASESFEQGVNQNRLSDEDVSKIIDTYRNRKKIDKYSNVVTLDNIKENNFNLNMPRYVDTFEEENSIDINEVQQEIEEINKKIIKMDEKINNIFKEFEVL